MASLSPASPLCSFSVSVLLLPSTSYSCSHSKIKKIINFIHSAANSPAHQETPTQTCLCDTAVILQNSISIMCPANMTTSGWCRSAMGSNVTTLYYNIYKRSFWNTRRIWYNVTANKKKDEEMMSLKALRVCNLCQTFTTDTDMTLPVYYKMKIHFFCLCIYTNEIFSI